MKSFILCRDLSGLGFSRGKNKTKVSNLASREFLPLSCMEGKEPGNGTPIHKLGTGSLLVMLVFNALSNSVTPALVTSVCHSSLHSRNVEAQ